MIHDLAWLTQKQIFHLETVTLKIGSFSCSGPPLKCTTAPATLSFTCCSSTVSLPLISSPEHPWDPASLVKVFWDKTRCHWAVCLISALSSSRVFLILLLKFLGGSACHGPCCLAWEVALQKAKPARVKALWKRALFRRDYGTCLIWLEVLRSRGVHGDPQDTST